MFDIGFQELLIIVVVALLVIGPQRLPEFSRTLGKWVNEIKKGIQAAKNSIEAEYQEQSEMTGGTIESDRKGEQGKGDFISGTKEGKV
jgi:Tat protein translocase TatB subunit